MMASNPWREGFEATMFRTVNDQLTLWESILPPELLVLPVELGRVDALLDDPVFFAPFAAYFDARIGRPSIPMETYLRLMFLKFRYRLGYESLCREVSDSISWQRFCRIPFGTRVPHPTTLMKITTRCGDDAVACDPTPQLSDWDQNLATMGWFRHPLFLCPTSPPPIPRR
jgi:transposase, IS5 family